ncbi:MAG TPA: SDR family oxidoreductase [Nitrospirota bacterium]|nr:SDR family oxidoreductase [Nitrospirota bacterium]
MMQGSAKILILGITGMLGHSLFIRLSERTDFSVLGTSRRYDGLEGWLSPQLLQKVRNNIDVNDFDSVHSIVNEIRPDVVINCIGIVKQLPEAKNSLLSISINSLFPHQLARTCETVGARMIHISTDCVFSGKKGAYTEEDFPDANDLYGRTKLLGEVDYPRCVTLRTSIIGHELKGRHGLIEWFLSQEGKVRGFTRAIYSGFPTIEMGNIISDWVIPNKGLHGLYHVSSDPISKYELLRLVAERYGKKIEIEPFDDFVLDRSLDSKRFRAATGYRPPRWPELVDAMYRDFKVRHRQLS